MFVLYLISSDWRFSNLLMFKLIRFVKIDWYVRDLNRIQIFMWFDICQHSVMSDIFSLPDITTIWRLILEIYFLKTSRLFKSDFDKSLKWITICVTEALARLTLSQRVRKEIFNIKLSSFSLIAMKICVELSSFDLSRPLKERKTRKPKTCVYMSL